MNQNHLFIFFALILVYSALKVVTAKNPIYAVLHLILAFFTAGGLWAMMTAEFLAIAIILIYVGAVMVLFLFVVMMLDINIDEIRQGFWQYAPLGFTIALVIFAEMAVVLANKYFASQTTIAASSESNVKELGILLYTDYAYTTEIASLVLLVAMVAAIALSYRGKKSSHYRNPAEQIAVNPQERMRIVKMPSSIDADITSVTPKELS